jgi:hypothetical protein
MSQIFQVSLMMSKRAKWKIFVTWVAFIKALDWAHWFGLSEFAPPSLGFGRHKAGPNTTDRALRQ